MKLVGYVKGLTVSRGVPYWSGPNIYHCYGEGPNEVRIVINDVTKILTDFLMNKSLHTKDAISKDEITTYRIIGVSTLRVMYCSEREAIFSKKKINDIQYVRYKFLDELKELISEIDMIAKLGSIYDQDVYLKFYLQ